MNGLGQGPPSYPISELLQTTCSASLRYAGRRRERNDFGRQFSGFGDEQASLKDLSIPSLNELRRMLPIEATKAATVHPENA